MSTTTNITNPAINKIIAEASEAIGDEELGRAPRMTNYLLAAILAELRKANERKYISTGPR